MSKIHEKPSRLTVFGKHCRKLRVDHGISLQQTAAKMGVSSSMLSQVETGRKPLTWSFLRNAIQAYIDLGCETEDRLFPFTAKFLLAYDALANTEAITINLSDIKNISHKEHLFRFFVMLLLDEKYPLDGFESGNNCLNWVYPCKAIDALETNPPDASGEIVFAREQEMRKLDRARKSAIEETIKDISIKLIRAGLNDKQITEITGAEGDKIAMLRQQASNRKS